jgi:hypothetical protein
VVVPLFGAGSGLYFDFATFNFHVPEKLSAALTAVAVNATTDRITTQTTNTLSLMIDLHSQSAGYLPSCCRTLRRRTSASWPSNAVQVVFFSVLVRRSLRVPTGSVRRAIALVRAERGDGRTRRQQTTGLRKVSRFYTRLTRTPRQLRDDQDRGAGDYC